MAALTQSAQDLTVNVASTHGGTVLNRVPHHASAELEMRAFDPMVLEAAENALRSLTASPTPAGARFQVTRLGSTQAWPGGSGEDRLVALWEQAAAELGVAIHPTSRGGLSDANYLHSLGPTLDALGPFGACAHCSENDPANGKTPEYVHPSSFVPKAVLNALALLQLHPTTSQET